MGRRKAVILGDWRDEAICVTYPPNFFYPEKSSTGQARAKAVCARCPVRGECLSEAIQNKEGYGIWGGMDTSERNREARRRRRMIEINQP